VIIRSISPSVTKGELESRARTYGSVQHFDLVGNNMDRTAYVTYETQEEAQQAVNSFNHEQDYNGGGHGGSSSMKADFYNGNGGNRYNQQRPGNGPPRQPRNSGTQRGTGYPLRIMVPSDLVGAIIGRKGTTIRNITTQCKARIDVHRDNNAGLLEKYPDFEQSLPQVISIYGQPDNCSNACKEILKVMQTEATSNNRGEMVSRDVSLKMLADDRYCGRIIGKEGKVIKKIREDTDTKITVSNVVFHSVQEMPTIYPDRVISIKGSLDNMAAAEATISTKLRECYEKEMQQPQGPQGMMGGPPMMGGGGGGMYGGNSGSGMGGGAPYMMQGGGAQYGGGAQARYQQGGAMGGAPPQYGGGMGGPPQQPPISDTCQISVPNSSVGAIIGAGGANIKQIIRESNAFVTIEPKKDDDTNPSVERIVTIKGNPDSIWRASFFVFEKLKQEGFAGNDDVRLRTAMKVPKSMVGRVIGRGGKNVRDIQRLTGAMVKLPEDQNTQGDEVVVEVFGNFMATQNAQSRVRALVMQSMLPPGGPNGQPQRPSAPSGPAN